MIHNFDKSEEYRKYIVGIQLDKLKLYTVWGTDMIDNEEDKLLVENGRLIVFNNLEKLAIYLQHALHPFVDRKNFEKWIAEENLKQVYNVNDLRLLSNFNMESLQTKTTALSILDSLNFIQDFFIQIKEKNRHDLYENKYIVELKDFIYDNYFWESGSRNLSSKFEHNDVKGILKSIYNSFHDKMEIVPENNN